MMEQDAAPAGRRRMLLLHSGGAGAPPAGTMTRREELADGRVARPVRGAKARLPKRGRVRAPTAGRCGRRKRGPAL